MSGAVRVLLPPPCAHLASLVKQAGCTPVIDATTGSVPEVPDGAWLRTRPGHPAPGTGPVILAELGAPIPDRPTWLETSVPRDVPKGYAGLILKGREAAGLCGDKDGLEALAACPAPERVILEAGLGPHGAGAAAALGAAGVLLTDTWLGCPEVGLPAALDRRLDLPDDEITQIVAGLRVGNPATSPVLRALSAGASPWELVGEVWTQADLAKQLWFIGQGAALARGLADRYGTLEGLLRAYGHHWTGWRELARRAVSVDEAIPVHTSDALAQEGTAASTGGAVGSGVLWEMAAWLGRPVHGGPTLAAAAVGAGVFGDRSALAQAQAGLPAIRAKEAAPEAPVAPATSSPAAPIAAADSSAAAAIAVIGIGCRFPGANSTEAFWQNIIGGVSAITELPPDRWDTELYYDPDHDAPDKSYSKIGAFITDFEFDSKRFRIPPKVAKQIDPVQQICLASVADALDDAGLKVDAKSDGRAFDRSRCAVILGNSLGGEVSDIYAIRLHWHAVDQQLAASAEGAGVNPTQIAAIRKDIKTSYLADLPEINEDSMPGELANVIAGRIANAFDLGGANFTVDAACASSMAAIQAAVKTLQDGEADLVVTGGADRSMNIATYVKFCKIGALSPDHSSPFDASANGFVMGEGCGILVLKRYEEAVADGDKIYSVIRGIGASSDGKGKGITAPNPIGQKRALERAWEAAGIAPGDLDLVECHGTSTVVGDKVEVEALSEMIGPDARGERGPVRIGSVKSMIGHLKSAAGAASCIKASLALYHGVYPPSLGFESPPEGTPLDVVPLKVQTLAEPWPEPPAGPRRCGVSAFGFGGTNFHVVLEGYTGRPLPKSVMQTPPIPQPDAPRTAPTASAAPRTPALDMRSAPPSEPVVAPDLPEGIWATSGVDRAELLANLKSLAAGRPAPFHAAAPLRIAAASIDADERMGQLKRSIAAVDKETNPDMLRARAIHFEEQPFDGKLALLFTGQGSQYLDMGLDLAAAYSQVSDTFDQADTILAPTLGRPITDFIRLAPGEDADAKSDLLRQTEYSQPATLTMDIAILRLLAAYGVSPDLVAGHSLGEYGAAVAAGVMTFEQALYAVSARGREMASIRLEDPGKMAGVAASTDVVEAVLAEVDGYVIAANKNCPTQTVIAGASDAVDEASERFKARGMTVYPLPVSHAFHSSIVAPASEPLRGVLTKLGLKEPRRPITTNVTGEYYPTGEGAVEQIIDLLAQQISAPVEWVAQMERMYADGARVFAEVGPKRALSGFTVSILKRRPHRALYTNHPKRGGVASFRDSLAGLLCYGFPIRPEPLTGVIDLFAPADPRLATTTMVQAFAHDVRPDEARGEALPGIHQGVLQIVANTTGYEIEELDLDYELEADLGIDTVKQAEVFSVVRATWNLPEDKDFDFSANRTLRSVIDWVAESTGGHRIAVAPSAPAPVVAVAPAAPAAAPVIGNDAIAAFLTQAARAGVDTQDGEAFAQALLPAVQGLLSAAFAAAQAAKPVPAPAPPVRPAPAPVASAPARVLSIVPGCMRPPDPWLSVVCTGASIGLPGGDSVFSPKNLVAMLSGTNRIDHIGDRTSSFLDKGLVRLVKDAQSGQGSFLPVTEADQVIRLAGIRSQFDIGEWGIPESFARALDITTKLAFAAGLEALRDAGIPLVRVFKTSASGKQVPQGWQLPESLRDGTGVIFGSAFPGYDSLVEHFAHNGDDGDGHFDRRFLFQVLSMGHSQFAQFIGARGPNTAVNAACASTTQGLAIAEDWLRMGRCERVIVVGSDDVTSPNLLPWIGSGFMAAGAATTHDVVEEAALPFDARRHGMILGMGAVGMVLERADLAAERGVVPVAELAGSLIVNSAFHGTRLDTDHIRVSVSNFIGQVSQRTGVSTSEMARSAFFVSHETYTPARGGSSAAEVAALRGAFGADADRIAITNTKGYTGHPMGAGIEDAVAVKGLQYGIVPPVANLEEPDPELGSLNLSRGLQGDYQWCVRLAAGFGSQLAVSVWRRSAVGDNRVPDARVRADWLHRVTGFAAAAEVVEQRTLRVLPADADHLVPMVPEFSPADHVHFGTSAPLSPTPAPAPEARKARAALPTPVPVGPAPAAAPGGAPAGDPGSVLVQLTAVIAEKTGYEPEELEPDFELEADLGIDTVKQAEIISELSDRYGLSRDEGFNMADYPTIELLAFYLSGVIGQNGQTQDRPQARVSTAPVAELQPVFTPPVQAPAPAPDAPVMEAPPVPKVLVVEAAPAVEEPAVAAKAATSARLVAPSSGLAGEPSLPQLISVVAEKTGYEPEELEPDFELEADLGVDTVKQAEIISALQEHYELPRDEDFSLADHPTLGALATYLDGRRGLGDPSEAPTAAPFSEIPPSIDDVRFENDDSLDETPAPVPERVQPSTGRKWVAEEFELRPMMTDEQVAERDSPPLPDSFRIRRPVLIEKAATGTDSLEGRAVAVLGSGTVADAVRDEVALRRGSLDGPFDTVIDLADDVITSFHKAKELEGARPAHWLTVTRLGGLGGIYPIDRGHSDGARAGFTKSLGREWEATQAKVVDIPSGERPSDLARAVCDELTAAADPEVFLREGTRRVVGYDVEDRPRALVPETPLVVLITGGARGICARVAQTLARRADVSLALVGRGPAGVDSLDEKKEKLRIKADIAETGKRPTPAKVEAVLGPLRAAEEIRVTLERLRELGRTAEYFRCDTSDADAVRKLVEEVEAKLGPVGLCIHGAGVEESRLIGDKDDAAFHRVFDGKAVGGAALVDALPAECTFVSMGSVAGRFGNPGQVDYAAANDAMARICLTRAKSLHVDWTAWDDVGMASRGGMKHLLTERGVDLLPAAAGAALLVDLIAGGVTGELVVAGNLGDFMPAPGHPLLDRVELDGDIVRATHELSLANDPWIADHSIDGVALLPGVIGLEMMAAAAALVLPGKEYTGARNVRFNAPVKVHGDRVTEVIVEARPTPRSDEVRARLVSVRKLRTGRVTRTEHFSATVVFGDDSPPDGLPSAFLPDEPIAHEAIYERFFHGPRFQVLRGVFGVSADGLVAEATIAEGGIAPGLVTSPLVLESAFQAAGLHRMLVAHEMGLPMEIDEVALMGAGSHDKFSLTVQLIGNAYDIDVDGIGGPLMRVRGFSLIDRGPLPDGDRWPVPEGGRPVCFPKGTASTRAGGRTTAEAHADEDSAAWLTEEERDALATRGTERRVRDRLAGRIAAKRALQALTGVNPLAIRVPSAESGEPIARVPGHPGVSVSISHREGRAIAVAVDSGRVGVDLEQIEERPAHFDQTWFDAAERSLAGNSLQRTVLWSVKEAVLKVLGTGMALSPNLVRVRALGSGTATVELLDGALARHAELGGTELVVTWATVDNQVVAEARLAA